MVVVVADARMLLQEETTEEDIIKTKMLSPDNTYNREREEE